MAGDDDSSSHPERHEVEGQWMEAVQDCSLWSTLMIVNSLLI